jgi:hypothetical protein
MHAVHAASQGEEGHGVVDITARVGGEDQEEGGQAHGKTVHRLPCGGAAHQVPICTGEGGRGQSVIWIRCFSLLHLYSAPRMII